LKRGHIFKEEHRNLMNEVAANNDISLKVANASSVVAFAKPEVNVKARAIDRTPMNSDAVIATSLRNLDTRTNGSYLLLIPMGLIALQILDGVLTLTGMLTFGLGAEANPLLRGLMSHVGLVPALLATKLACIAVVVMLWSQAARIAWLPTALSLVAGVYAVGAVIPWSVLLVSNYLS
jgi:hypothetical protein